MLSRATRALEDDTSERQHALGIGREDSDWGLRTIKGELLEGIEVWVSLQPVFECLRLFLAQRAPESAVGSSTWAYALRSCVGPARRQARWTASTLLEVAMQSAFQEKCSYTMAVRGILDG